MLQDEGVKKELDLDGLTSQNALLQSAYNQMMSSYAISSQSNPQIHPQPISINSFQNSHPVTGWHTGAGNNVFVAPLTPASFPSVNPAHFNRLSASEPGTLNEIPVLNENSGDKRRKRRESHNAVERRRRDTINEKIHELSTLLPDLVNDMNNGGPRPNKGTILRRSVDYLRHLHKLIRKQDERTNELERELRKLLRDCGKTEEDLGLSLPLGHVIINCEALLPPPLLVCPQAVSNVRGYNDVEEAFHIYPNTETLGYMQSNNSCNAYEDYLQKFEDEEMDDPELA